MVQNIFPDISEWVYVGILAAGGLALLAFFLIDRSDWGILIPAYVLLAAALITTVALEELFAQEDLMGSVVLILIAIPFLAVYFRDRAQWWALIPGYIMLAISFVILLETQEVIGDEAIGAFITASIGLPFLVVYLQKRDQWWALIPAYTMFAIAILIAFIEPIGDEEMVVPAYVMFAIAIPFLYVYIRNRQNWWALIPGGIMSVIGLGFLMTVEIAQFLIPAVLIIAGIWVLMRQSKQE